MVLLDHNAGGSYRKHCFICGEKNIFTLKEVRGELGIILNITRQHSGRMRTARLPTGRGYPLPNALWVMVTWRPPEHNDRQTPVKILPSRNSVCSR